MKRRVRITSGERGCKEVKMCGHDHTLSGETPFSDSLSKDQKTKSESIFGPEYDRLYFPLSNWKHSRGCCLLILQSRDILRFHTLFCEIVRT